MSTIASIQQTAYGKACTMRRAFIGILMGTAIGLSPFMASAGEPAFAEAQQIFMQAREGRDGALEKATEKFKALAEKDAANPLFQSYLGACLALKGDSAWMPWSKMRYTEQGLDKIDAALASLASITGDKLEDIQKRLETRYVAAETFIKIPDKIFHRAAAGRKLLQEVTSSPDYPKTNAAFRAVVDKFSAAILEGK